MITHQINEIKVVDDHGKEYTVFEYQGGTEKSSLKWIKAGPSSFRLSDGTAVAKIDDNTFKIDSNARLVRVKSDVSEIAKPGWTHVQLAHTASRSES